MTSHPPFGSSAASRLCVVVFVACIAGAAAPSLGQGSNATRSLYTANGLLNRGLHEEAAGEYREFLERAADAEAADIATARYGLAVCLMHAGHEDDALDQLGLISGAGELRGFALADDAALLEGQILYNRGDFEAAAGRFRSLAGSEFARSSEAASLWIECLHRLGEHRAATRAWGRIAESDASEVRRGQFFAGLSYLERDQHERALATLLPLTETSGELQDAARYNAATAALADGNRNTAVEQYRALIDRGGKAWALPAARELARMHNADGRPDLAIAALDHARDRFGSETAPIVLERGIALSLSGAHEAAVGVLGALTDAGDDRVAAAVALWSSRSLLALDQHDRAERALRDALKVHHRSAIAADLWYELGRCLVGQSAYEPALSAFESAANSAGEARDELRQQARLASAKVLAAMDRREDAAHLARSVDSPSLRAEAEMLSAMWAVGSPSDRADELRAWLEDHADHDAAGTARVELAMSLARSGDLEQATAIIKREMVAQGERATAAAFEVLGDAAFDAEQWNDANEWYRLSAQHASGDGHLVALKQGMTSLRAGDAEAAVEWLEQAARSNDAETRRRATFELGQSFLELDQPDRARAMLERTADGDEPIASASMLHLGRLAEQSGDFNSAADWYERADRPDDQARVLLAAGDLDSLADGFDPQDGLDARVYQQVARARLGESDPSDLRRALRRDGVSVEAQRLGRHEVASTLRRQGDLDGAMDELLAIADGPPDRVGLYAAIESALIGLDSGRDERDVAASIERAEAMIERDPSLADAYSGGAIEFARASLAASQEDHAEVLRRLSGFEERHAHHQLLGHACALRGEAALAVERPMDAVRSFTVAVEAVEPRDRPSVLLRLGTAHAQAQQWSESRSAYEAYLEASPSDAFEFEAWFGVGWALEHEGRQDDAISAYERVVSGHDGPTAARAQFQIGECYFAMGEHERAVKELLRVDILYDYPQWSAAAVYEAGRAFEQLRRFGDARSQYREVVERFADTQWAPLADERLGVLSRDG